ncbi:structural protein [Cellulophaga phage phi4:1]|uniref:Structural protein n=3 Tax=Lightbulbvirus Cba41 TaxID=1918524 RepID=A0A0S2MWG1_9CAUD|nr:tail protein [Cellulophaga phage phi4:1]AGO49454.1 structural protein [Cellulophaga phage phi4:1]ALO80050.1 structural protein [Cellulophaga phage phi4:1_13]ALO80247.1 structural protein [Cellulophaga phage phi4:1_18]
MARYKDKNPEEKQKHAYNFLLGRGYEPHQASAIVGNLMQESYAHLDSSIVNSIGAIGIAQWLGDRKKSLYKYAESKGTEATDFQTQLEFLDKELKSTGNSWLSKKKKESFFNATSVDEAARIFVQDFERSGETPEDKGYKKRLEYAEKVYSNFNQKKKSDGSSSYKNTYYPEKEVKVDNTTVTYPKVNTFNPLSQSSKTKTSNSIPQDVMPPETQEAFNQLKFQDDIIKGVVEQLRPEQKEQPLTSPFSSKPVPVEPTQIQQEPEHSVGYDLYTPQENEFLQNFLKEGGEVDPPTKPATKEAVVSESKEFVKNWFNDSTTKARYSANVGKGFNYTLPKIEEGVNNIDRAQINYNSPTNDKSADAEFKNGNISFFTTPTQSTATHEFTHAMGVDEDLTRYIRDNFGTPAAAIQGKTGLPFKDAIRQEFNIDDSTGIGKSKLNNTINHSRYLSENGELYPRVMEMRKHLNVKPGDVINDKQIEELQKTDNPLFKYYSPAQIKGILNTVADNSENNGNLTYAQAGGEQPKNFMLDYIQSDKYSERLNNSQYENPIGEAAQRMSNLLKTTQIDQESQPGVGRQLINKITDTPYSTVGSKFDKESRSVIYDESQLAKLEKIGPVSKEEVVAHELNHAMNYDLDSHTRLNKRDIEELTNRLKPSVKDKHSLKPEENQSDLQAFRFILNKEGIYDARKEDFGKKHLEKAKKSFSKNRLLKNYKEEDVIWLMNNIANNFNSENKNLT